MLNYGTMQPRIFHTNVIKWWLRYYKYIEKSACYILWQSPGAGRMCVVMSPAVIIAINTFGLTEATCNYFLWTEIFSGQLTTMIHRCLHHEDLELVHASYLSVPTSCCLNTECFCGSFIYLSSFWSKPDKIRVEGSWNIPPAYFPTIINTHLYYNQYWVVSSSDPSAVYSS